MAVWNLQKTRTPVSPRGDQAAAPAEASHIRLDVQGLRAVAVGLVVAFHAGLPVPGGFIGVDVFLVVSGFVITSMLLREVERSGTIKLRNFYSRRVKRLLPALAVLTTAVMVLAVVLGTTFSTQEITAKTGLGATYLVANVVIYEESTEYFSPAAETNPLLHTWTLSVEEQTYLVFPSLLLGAWAVGRLLGRRARDASRWSVGGMLVVIGTASFLLSFWVSTGRTSTPVAWAFFSSLARVWEFAVGAGLALAATRLRRINPWTALILGVAGAVAIGVGAFTLSGDIPYPGVAALVPVLGAAAVIAAGFRSTSIVPRGLAARPMVWIGDLSYSWYLWHWPLIVFAAVLWPGRAWVLVAAAAVSLIVAVGSYVWVERPIRQSAGIRGRGVLAVLLICLAVPTVAGLVLAAGARSSWGNEGVQQMQEQIDARGDFALAGCDEGQPEGEPCVHNAASRDTPVYLFGNSIAAMYSEGMVGTSDALDLPVHLDTHPGGFCFRTDAVGCPEMFVPIFDELLRGGEPGIVVLAGTWDVGSFSGSEDELEAAELTAELSPLVDELQAAGHHVVIMLPTPRFFYGAEPGTFSPVPLDTGGGREPHETVWRPQDCPSDIAEDDPAACGAVLPVQDVVSGQTLAVQTLRTIAAETGASTFDLRARYCEGGLCRTNDGDYWMYEDGIHLSAGESEALAPVFSRVIRDLLKRLADADGPVDPVAYTYGEDGSILIEPRP